MFSFIVIFSRSFFYVNSTCVSVLKCFLHVLLVLALLYSSIFFEYCECLLRLTQELPSNIMNERVLVFSQEFSFSACISVPKCFLRALLVLFISFAHEFSSSNLPTKSSSSAMNECVLPFYSTFLRVILMLASVCSRGFLWSIMNVCFRLLTSTS